MSRVIYLSIAKHKPTKTLSRRVSGPHAQELAHDVKNCMSTLLLALATLERDGDQWKITARGRQALEDIVFEMDRLIDEMLEMTKNSAAKAHSSRCLIGQILDERQNARTIIDA
jgi:signal transduction histidine kinase